MNTNPALSITKRQPWLLVMAVTSYVFAWVLAHQSMHELGLRGWMDFASFAINLFNVVMNLTLFDSNRRFVKEYRAELREFRRLRIAGAKFHLENGLPPLPRHKFKRSK